MKPLRIVLVMIEAPVPFGNAAARWFYVLLRELVARGHRVTAFAACSKPKEIEEARQLFPAPEYDLRLYPFPERRGLRAKLETLRRPYSYMFSDELKTDLETELSHGYDILHLEHIWSGWVGLRHTSRALFNVLSLYAIDLAESAPGIHGWFRRWLILRAERFLVQSYPQVATLSDRLAEGIQQINRRAIVHVVTLGIDPDRYPYIPDNRRAAVPVISLIGSMTWHPSHSAAVRLLTRLWPEIKKRVPTATVQVIGWGAREALREYLGMPGVEITENVPDTRPYFERSSVLLYAPARGSGVKVKVLEAFGYGVPVVTTSEGVEGLPAEDGVHAGICDDDASLIDRTVALLFDPARQNHQRAAARTLLEQHCGPIPSVDRIEQVYTHILAAPTAGAPRGQFV